jgi:hypothetical protein
MGKPWQAYSWLFELITFHLFHRFSLAGIVGYTIGMIVAITVSLHHLVKRLQRDFTIVIFLAGTVCLTLGRLYTPRPWLFSILFFVLELDILMHARRSGRLREFVFLPVLFAVWVNVHIQFIDGLVVLALAMAESFFLAFKRIRNSVGISPLPLAITCAVSLLATLVNPYGWHIYQVAHDLAAQPGPLSFVMELQPLPFRNWTDYSVLFLAFAAVAALARVRRFLPFETALFLFAAIVSFRSQRDLWIVVIIAAVILASTIEGRSTPVRLPALASLPLTVSAVVILLLGSRLMHIDNAELNKRLSCTLPVKAVEAAKTRQYPGPIYNNYGWGGYLIWELRQPVSIDGRAALHGDERINRSRRTWDGEPDWATDPQLLSAGLVVAPVKSPLTQLLRLDPKFKLTYEDQQAALFLRNPPTHR